MRQLPPPLRNPPSRARALRKRPLRRRKARNVAAGGGEGFEGGGGDVGRELKLADTARRHNERCVCSLGLQQ